MSIDEDGEGLVFRLEIENLENVVQAHIHVGPAGENGPIVVFLLGPEPPGGGLTERRVVEGTATAADFVGPLAGQPFSALLENMTAGNTYVNVHTDDGVAPPNTGPGDFPGGEIRGQLFAACAGGVTLEALPDGSVLVDWEGVPLAQEFHVFRRAADEPGAVFERIATVQETQFLDETTVPGETFDYAVQPSNGRLDVLVCDEVSTVTAVPFLAGALGGLALAGGVGAYAWARRR